METGAIIAQRGTGDFMVAVGRGDALGQTNVELARVYDQGSDSLSDPAPVSSIAARGYWNELAGDEGWLRPVRERVAALLA